MLTKNEIKFVNSLKQKKFREQYNLFIAEGTKLVSELLNSSITVKQVYATSEFFRAKKMDPSIQRFEIKASELDRISAVATPKEVLAVCEIPGYELKTESLKDKLTLVLDDIKDPGNMGTIIRVADWFGIDTIICSNETVDAFSPKVVQATMGSIARVEVYYDDLAEFFKNRDSKPNPRCFGALLKGENIYKMELPSGAIIIIGNESKGISEKLLPYITDKISIPSFSHFKSGDGEAESLNAAIATSIICSEFRRR